MPFQMEDDPGSALIVRETDIDLDAPVAMTKREVVNAAHGRISGVIAYALDLGQMPDDLDCQRIREAGQLLGIAVAGEPAGQQPNNPNRTALLEAHGRISGVIAYALDLGQMPDDLDCQRIREAGQLLASTLGSSTEPSKKNVAQNRVTSDGP